MKNNMMNILFLVHDFNIGGIQKANISMINQIDKKKFNVHVLYINEGMLMNDLTANVELKKLGSIYKLKSLINIKYILKIIKYSKNNNIQLIHTIDPVLYLVGATASRLINIKHVRTQPNFIRRHEKLNAKTLRFTPFERWTNKYITYQDGSAKDLNKAGVKKGKIKVIRGYDSLDDLLYYKDTKDIKKELNIPKNNKIILAMHRMIQNKGYETFIDMIPYVLEEYNEVTFLLVGDGPLKGLYEEKVRLLGVSKNVIFTGFRKDIANIIKQIDFGIYPLADTAAMGSVIRSGKVIITKKNSSMDEYIINRETGFLVSKDESKIYAKYALKLLNNSNLILKMEDRQRQNVIKNFDGNKNIKILEDIFINLYKTS